MKSLHKNSDNSLQRNLKAIGREEKHFFDLSQLRRPEVHASQKIPEGNPITDNDANDSSSGGTVLDEKFFASERELDKRYRQFIEVRR